MDDVVPRGQRCAFDISDLTTHPAGAVRAYHGGLDNHDRLTRRRRPARRRPRHPPVLTYRLLPYGEAGRTSLGVLTASVESWRCPRPPATSC